MVLLANYLKYRIFKKDTKSIFMKEELIVFAWQYGKYVNPLKTVGEMLPVEVIDVGLLNKDSGPDFFNAKVKIGNELWAGNVEIHLKSSDWNNHGHYKDKAYNNTILHVVLKHDEEVYLESGQTIPTIELQINPSTLQQYFVLENKSGWLRCKDQIKVPNTLSWISLTDRLLIERLEYRVDQIDNILKKTSNNWEIAFWRILARAYGFGLNSDAFQLIATKIPLKLFKLSNSLEEVEALWFGVAGLLEGELKDEYQEKLKSEFDYLRAKFNVTMCDSSIWKFAKTRPSNFPTVRIGQFCALIYSRPNLLSEVVNSTDIKTLKVLFDLKPSAYWQKHYKFGKETRSTFKAISAEALNGLIINTIVPFLYHYGKVMGKNTVSDKAFVFLRNLKAENNSLIRGWLEVGFPIQTAFDSQAMIHLRKNYCDKRDCLKCQLGRNLLCK